MISLSLEWWCSPEQKDLIPGLNRVTDTDTFSSGLFWKCFRDCKTCLQSQPSNLLTVSPAVLCWTRPSRPPTRLRLQACASAMPPTARPPCWSPPARTGTSKPGSWLHNPRQTVSSLSFKRNTEFGRVVSKCGYIYCSLLTFLTGEQLKFILWELSVL